MSVSGYINYMVDQTAIAVSLLELHIDKNVSRMFLMFSL